MKREEAVCRRYCHFSGLDPDELIGGVRQWVLYKSEIIAAMNTLDTFNLRFDNPFEVTKDDGQLELSLSQTVIKLRH